MSAPVIQVDGVVTDSLFDIYSDGSVNISDNSCDIANNGTIFYEQPQDSLKNFTFVEAYSVEVFDINTHEMVGYESFVENFKINKSADKKSATNPHGQELWSLCENVKMNITYDECLQSTLSIAGRFGGVMNFANANATIKRPVSEVKTIKNNSIVLKYTPVDPADIIISVVTKDDQIGRPYTYDIVASDGTFTVDGNVVTFAPDTFGIAMVNYDRAMTNGAVISVSPDNTYPIRELHVNIKVKDNCTQETFSGVWVFYRVQRDATSAETNFTVDGKTTQSWNTIYNASCTGSKMSRFFIDFDGLY